MTKRGRNSFKSRYRDSERHMAYCPECANEIAAAATSCDHCGFEWPKQLPELSVAWVYSKFADIVLLFQAVLFAIGCVVVLFFMAISCLAGEWLWGLVGWPLVFFAEFTMFVLIMRVRDFNRSKRESEHQE